MTLINEAERGDALVRVESPAVAEARLLVDHDCDGQPEVEGRIPLPAQEPVRTPAPGVPDGPEVDYRVDLRRDQPLGSGSTVPVTFTFRNAGSTTLNVPVELSGQPLQQDLTRCEPSR